MNKYVIYGLGISGIAAAEFLESQNFEVILTQDDESQLVELKKKYPKFTFQEADKINYDLQTIIIFSPGIPLYFPKKHKILEICKKSKAKLICDIELFYKLNKKNNDFIAITGTNGKSTVTALTGFVFQQLEISSQIGGNIGFATFNLKQKQNNFNYIFETSSYQLDLIEQFRPKISVLLNITPDHIDRHGNLENYINSKKRIFLNQKAGDFAIIDVDNVNSNKIFEELNNDKNFEAQLIAISTKENLAKENSKLENSKNKISIIGDFIYINLFNQNLKFELKSEFLKGEHNKSNIAFAFAISLINQVNKNIDFAAISQKIISAILKFKGLKHRQEFLGKIANINFINDSKATNAMATNPALKAYDNIYWILGGVSKEEGIAPLIPFFNNVKKAYLIGKAAPEFAKILKENKVNFEISENLETASKNAFLDAKKDSKNENNILLSPACSSFDQWNNFEERGEYFCKIFNELSAKKT